MNDQLVIPTGDLIPPKDGEHFYYCGKCGKQHDRVTTMIAQVVPKWALVPWAEGAARRAAIHIYKDTGTLPTNERELVKAIKALNMDTDSLRDLGRERGNVAHRYLNRYIETGKVESVFNFDEAHRPYLTQLARFIIDYEPEFLCSELALAHCPLGYAGQTDGIALIHRQPSRRNKPIDLTGKRVLFDLKSNREGRVYKPDFLWQIAGYELAWRYMGGEPNDHQIVVAVGESSYQAAVSYFEPEAFGALARFYRESLEQEARNPNARS